MRVDPRFGLAVFLLGSAPWAAWGQGGRQVRQDQYQIPFNLSSPGARSLALGGAFAALADDATAAYANPAGLTNLSLPEVSLEGRSWKYASVFPDRGRSFGILTGQGQDTVDRVVNGRSSDAVTGLSFLSFVLPVKRGALAVYRHELSNFEANIEAQGVFLDGIGPSPTDPATLEVERARFFPTRTRADLSVVSHGVGGAFRLTESLSVGVTLTHFALSLDAHTRRFDTAGFYGPADFGREVSRVESKGDDEGYGFTVGLLWQATGTWSLGAVYRQGTELDVGVQDFVVSAEGLRLSRSARERFGIPDVLVVGTAFQVTDQLTWSGEIDRVSYADVSRGAVPGVEADDTFDFHFGLEYVVLRYRHPLSLRLGAWYEPDHQPSYREKVDESVLARSLATRFPRREDEWHYSGGLGIAVGQAFQLDAAVDLSEPVKTLSLSTVYRF